MNFCIKCYKRITKNELNFNNGICYFCSNKAILQKRQKFVNEYGVCKN